MKLENPGNFSLTCTIIVKADNRQLQAVLEYKIIIWCLLQLQNQLVKERRLDSPKYLDVYMFDGHNINLNCGG